MKVVATIAGSDSGGGAGIQADLRSISANGGFGTSVVTAITAQNTLGVTMAQDLSTELIEAQFDAVFSDIEISAIKTGMLATGDVIETVARKIRQFSPSFYVMDPVMVSTSGHSLLEDDARNHLKTELFPLATLVTPNIHETEVLVGREIRTLKDAAQAGKQILEHGSTAVLIKGGHLLNERATDLLVTDNGIEVIPGEWIESKNTHGTGCTYSAAIATHLARGASLSESVRTAKLYVTEAIRTGVCVGSGSGPTDHFYFLRKGDFNRWDAALNLRNSGDE